MSNDATVTITVTLTLAQQQTINAALSWFTHCLEGDNTPETWGFAQENALGGDPSAPDCEALTVAEIWDLIDYLDEVGFRQRYTPEQIAAVEARLGVRL
jgi:hypothetical protein